MVEHSFFYDFIYVSAAIRLLAPALVNLAHPCAMASLSADDYEPLRI